MTKRQSGEFVIHDSTVAETKMVPSSDGLFNIITEEPERQPAVMPLPVHAEGGSSTRDGQKDRDSVFEEIGYSRPFVEPDTVPSELRDARIRAGISTNKMLAEKAREAAGRYYEDKLFLTGKVPQFTPEERTASQHRSDKIAWERLQRRVADGEISQVQANALYRKHLNRHQQGS